MCRRSAAPEARLCTAAPPTPRLRFRARAAPRVLQRLDVVDVLHLRIHHPDVRQADVRDETERARHDPDENRRLLRDQQRGERQTDDDADVFGPVTDEHFDRDEIHDRLSQLCLIN